jgi:DNA-binding MarR family transcriptional regulator
MTRPPDDRATLGRSTLPRSQLGSAIKTGELERTPHPTDRRARLIGLTDAGRQRMERAIPAYSAAYRQLLGQLEHDGADVEAIFGALSALRVGIVETSVAIERDSARSA